MTKYIDGINVENCNAILDWLDLGAPHAVFDMEISSLPVSQVCFDEDDEEDLEKKGVFYEQVETKGIGSCGTACCIAGAAYGMMKGDISKTYGGPGGVTWQEMSEAAGEWLGVPFNNDFYYNDLFENTRISKNATPADAAAALRRVMVGDDAWIEGEE